MRARKIAIPKEALLAWVRDHIPNIPEDSGVGSVDLTVGGFETAPQEVIVLTVYHPSFPDVRPFYCYETEIFNSEEKA